EKRLALKVIKFSETIDQLVKDYTPHILCLYLYNLANTFSSFYENCNILNAEENIKESRLALAMQTARVLACGLDLLGIKVTDKI
ncbi:MAG: DALR anticodon-binding domain-containing protein, partial [Psittacicella sp.]